MTRGWRVEALAYIRQGLLAGQSTSPDYQARLTSFEQAAALTAWPGPGDHGKYALYILLGNVAGRVADDYLQKRDTSQAQVYYEQAKKNYEEAERILIAHALEFPSVYLGLGDTNYHLALLSDDQHFKDVLNEAIENYQKAIKATEQASRQTPYLAAYARYGLAECYIIDNNLDEAFSLFTLIIQDYGSDARSELKERAAEAHARRGAIYNIRGDFHCALREYQLALEQVSANNKNRNGYQGDIVKLKNQQADASLCAE